MTAVMSSAQRRRRSTPAVSRWLCWAMAVLVACAVLGTMSAATKTPPGADNSGDALQSPQRAIASATSGQYRCQRPLSSLGVVHPPGSPTPNKLANCHFEYMVATDGAVEVRCEGARPTAGAGPGTLDDCNVSMTVHLEAVPDVAELLAARVGSERDLVKAGTARLRGGRSMAGAVLFDDDDVWRYTFRMKALESGAGVAYKGFDGNGYSLCCDGMTSKEQNCAWIAQQAGDNELLDEDDGATEEEAEAPRRRLLACPLPLPTQPHRAAGAGEGRPFVVQVTKPLPHVVTGPWEATLEFSRVRTIFNTKGTADDENEVLGRVLVKFNVDPKLLWSGANVVDVATDPAAAAARRRETEAVAIVPPTDGDVSGGDGDL